jgi:hypothetical protein
MKSTASRIVAGVIAALVGIAALMYLNLRISDAVPGGVDFLTHWVGTQALFHGESPYSREVAVRVQELVYGRPAQVGENEFLDPYLLQMEVVFAPFALLSDYTWARAAWMTFLELTTIAIFVISMMMAGWKPKLEVFSLFLVYAVLGYHSLRPVINGNVTTVITLMIVGAVWAIQKRKDHIAGILMAFALAKPTVIVVQLLLIIVWTMSVRGWSALGYIA